jgi:hypothetical protein
VRLSLTKYVLLRVPQYLAFTRSINDASNFYVGNLHQATRNMAQSITTLAAVHNQSFPFVTIDVFETLGRHARQQSLLQSVLYSPLVSNEERASWENYSVANEGWIAASQSQFMDVSGTTVTVSGDTAYTVAGKTPIFPTIWDTSTNRGQRHSVAPNTGPYLPLWMVEPLPLSGGYYINSNRFDAPSLQAQYYFTAGIARGK